MLLIKGNALCQIHETTKKPKRFTEKLQNSLNKIEEALKNDSTKALVEFLHEDAR